MSSSSSGMNLLGDGRYQVLSKLGEGGMALVYRARDLKLDTDVVIKMPRRNALDERGFVERFSREIRALVHLVHPHIVKIHDIGQHQKIPFAVLQYLSGGSLQRRIAEYARDPIRRDAHELLGEWLLTIGAALDFVHCKGYLHRDLKPANILFDDQGHAFLSDFGVAKVLWGAPDQKSGSLTQAGQLLGTPEYMAPELIMAEKYDGRIDQYALAATLYELLTGRPPFIGITPVDILVLQTSQSLRPLTDANPSLPAALGEVVGRGLAKNPNHRYGTCVELARAALVAADIDLSPMPVASDSSGVVRSTFSHAEDSSTPCPKEAAPPPARTFIEIPRAEISCPVCGERVQSASLMPVETMVRCEKCGQWFAFRTGMAKFSAPLIDSSRLEPLLSPPEGIGSAETPPGTLGPTQMFQQCILPAARSQVRRDRWAAIAIVGIFAVMVLSCVLFTPLCFLVGRGVFGASSASSTSQSDWSSQDPTANTSPVRTDDSSPPQIDLDLGSGTKLVLKRIPAKNKSFWMGSTGPTHFDEEQHQVEFSHDYYLGEWKVTQAQYKAVSGTNPSYFCAGGRGAGKVAGKDTDNFPVESISWSDAKEYCAALTKKSKERSYVFRLPTEAEWEFACRGGDNKKATMPYYLRTGPSGFLSSREANFDDSPEYVGRTSRCGGYSEAVNGFGLWDMHGNVWEWCADFYDPGYYKTSPRLDPTCEKENSQNQGLHVRRGGSWYTYAGQCTASYRGRGISTAYDNEIGFRVCAVRTR